MGNKLIPRQRCLTDEENRNTQLLPLHVNSRPACDNFKDLNWDAKPVSARRRAVRLLVHMAQKGESHALVAKPGVCGSNSMQDTRMVCIKLKADNSSC